MAERAKRSAAEAFTCVEEKPDVQHLPKLYKADRPSSLTPTQRFCTLSPINEAFPLYAEAAMKASDIEYGSMESVGLRTTAAKVVAKTTKGRDAAESPDVDHGPSNEPDDTLVNVHDSSDEEGLPSKDSVRRAGEIGPGTRKSRGAPRMRRSTSIRK